MKKQNYKYLNKKLDIILKKVYSIYCDVYNIILGYADVAELADALVLGTSVNDVGVQVPSSAPKMYLFELN